MAEAVPSLEAASSELGSDHVGYSNYIFMREGKGSLTEERRLESDSPVLVWK